MGAAEEKLRPLAHRSRSEAQISEEEKIYLKAYLTAETVENIQGKTKIPLKQIILKFCFQIKNIRKTIATNRIHQTRTFLYYDNVCSRSLISLVLQSFLWLGGANVHGAHGWGGGWPWLLEQWRVNVKTNWHWQGPDVCNINHRNFDSSWFHYMNKNFYGYHL